MPVPRTTVPAAALAALLGLAGLTGCGSSASASRSAASAPALAPDATSAATGDIPDTQVFVTYADPGAGFSMRYPEGWTVSRRSGSVAFRDKNNLVRIALARGAAPTVATAAAALARLKASEPSLAVVASPRTVAVAGRPAIRSTYTTQSAPNPVTGRRVLLVVDRYELASAGRVATVDLGSPKGVDNVDAYRMMIASFRWR